jgi:hypothetical protein
MVLLGALAILPMPGLASQAADVSGATSIPTCNIVYGDDWAFISQPPPAWTEACGPHAMTETAITLWPAAQDSNKAEALIYVTVSGKGNQTFDAFVAQEQASYRARDASQGSSVVSRLRHISPTRQSIHIANAQGGRNEVVVYVDGPTAYFIVVLTSDSPAHEVKYRGAFDRFLASFSPATLKHGGGG